MFFYLFWHSEQFSCKNKYFWQKLTCISNKYCKKFFMSRSWFLYFHLHNFFQIPEEHKRLHNYNWGNAIVNCLSENRFSYPWNLPCIICKKGFPEHSYLYLKTNLHSDCVHFEPKSFLKMIYILCLHELVMIYILCLPEQVMIYNSA